MKLTSYVQDRQLTIALTGEIDHHSAKEIMDVVSDKIDVYMPLRCILDFRDVRFMDSSGIAVVLHTLRRMNPLQGKLLLQNIPAQPYTVLRAYGANSSGWLAMTASTDCPLLTDGESASSIFLIVSSSGCTPDRLLTRVPR